MISAIFILLYGAFKGVTDYLKFHSSSDKWFGDPDITWVRKYKNNRWDEGPAFFGSTTFLVSFTDGWHFFEELKSVAIILAIIFYSPWLGVWDILILYGAKSIGFNATYEFLKLKK